MQIRRQLYSRRDLLTRLMATVAAGLVAPSLLAACGDSDINAGSTTATQACQDNVGLWDSATRRALSYVDPSPYPDKICANCRFYRAAQEGAPCGTCEIVSGPIAPLAYCSSWALQDTDAEL